MSRTDGNSALFQRQYLPLSQRLSAFMDSGEIDIMLQTGKCSMHWVSIAIKIDQCVMCRV